MGMKKHRILLVVRHPVGGIRTFCRYFYSNLDRAKYHFTLVAPDFPETAVLLSDLKELDLHYIPADRNVSNKDLFRLVTRVIRARTFELIHSHGFTAALCSIAAAVRNRIPHILTCHDVFTPRQFVGLKGIAKRTVLGIMLSMIDCIHCVSHDARDNLLAYLPILRFWGRRVVTVPHGIEIDRFLSAEKRDLRKELSLPPESFLIGFLGRFMSQKGFKYLVDAMAEMAERKDLPNRPVVLAFGEGGFIREEKAEVRKRGLAEAIHFLPFVPDVAGTLKGLDVVVMPSLWEACPLLPMEAMVAGVPVIGTNCIGLREVLSNTPAETVPPQDGAALAEALITEMKRPTTSEAREFVTTAAARFQVVRRAADLEKIIIDLIER
jgi:glycosyltransferase involved in cell wall biosynthesis